MSNSFKVGGAVLGTILVGGIILGTMSIASIEAGHAGVVWNRNGGLEDQTLGQGWHLISPLKRITEYPVSTNTVEYADVQVGTSDGKPITTSFSYNYHIDVDKLPAIFNKFKGQSSETLEEGFLRQRLTEAAKNVTTKYSVIELLGSESQEIALAIQKGFAEDVKDIGFIIESVTFTPPTPDAQTAEAIQAKVDAQQKLEQQKYELEKAKLVAETQRVQAQGNADKILIEAEGQAKANKILQQSLTDELIQMQIAEKWDGTLPQVTGETVPMITLPETTTNTK